MKNNLSKNMPCAELDNFIDIISCLPEQFTEKWMKMMENKQGNPTKVYGIENESFKDTLNRNAEIKSLSNLLKNVETPTVLAINSKWGTGKSTFINLWEKHLESDKEIETICFNAWKNDFAPDPLTAFLSEINPFFSKESKIADTNLYWEKAKKVGIYFSGKLIPIAAKTATAGLLDIDELSKFLEETGLEDIGIESELENLSKDLSKDAVNTYASHYANYKASVSLIDIFKKNLKAAIKEKGKRLVIFVDELDRCRPTYAIELLERIKHLFDIEGLVFVLSLDKEQLSHSIKAVYGQDMDADGYLKRFIDIEYRLKKPTPEKLENYIHYLFEQFNFEENEEIRNSFAYVLVFFTKHYHSFSLRDINRLVERINLIKNLFDDKQSLKNPYFCEVIVFLLLLRDRDYQIYSDYIHPESTSENILKHIDSTIGQSMRSSMPDVADDDGTDVYYYSNLCAYLIYVKSIKSDGYPVKPNQENWLNIWKSSDNTQKYYAKGEIIKHLKELESPPTRTRETYKESLALKELKKVGDKIELSTQFS
ncbi:P-loop NTPase fold protein [Candidatus Albibeggiatoa sp. nov. NOAA]|uniref:KAP family P-loop NTPase fold protein n=1 Tax=Candidatus Albibeggiatoa sp. nov. NOAA TaxID=3162724 RepID=UPI0033019A09|nr:KAP family NTPase [Thiotrichaceae bacterium]